MVRYPHTLFGELGIRVIVAQLDEAVRLICAENPELVVYFFRSEECPGLWHVGVHADSDVDGVGKEVSEAATFADLVVCLKKLSELVLAKSFAS